MGYHTDPTVPACIIPYVHLMRSSDGFTVRPGRVPSDFLTFCAVHVLCRQRSTGNTFHWSPKSQKVRKDLEQVADVQILASQAKREGFLPSLASSSRKATRNLCTFNTCLYNNYISLFLSKFLFLNIQTVKLKSAKVLPPAKTGKDRNESAQHKTMLGQNQKWKQNSSIFIMLIISLHLIVTCRTCCHGFASKLSPRLINGQKKLRFQGAAIRSAKTSTESPCSTGWRVAVKKSKWPSNTELHHLCDCGYLFNPCGILMGTKHCGIFMLGSNTRQPYQHDSRDSEKETQRSQNSAPASPDFTKTAEANKKPDDAWKTCYDRKGDGKAQTNVCLEPCHLCNSPNHTGNQRRENELARHMALLPLSHDIGEEGNRSRCWDTDKMRKDIVLDTQNLSMKYPSLSQSVQIQSKYIKIGCFQLEELTTFSWNPISIWPKTSFGNKNQCHRNKEGLTVWPCLLCHLHQAPQTQTKNECHNFQSRNNLLEIRSKLQTPTKPKILKLFVVGRAIPWKNSKVQT